MHNLSRGSTPLLWGRGDAPARRLEPSSGPFLNQHFGASSTHARSTVWAASGDPRFDDRARPADQCAEFDRGRYPAHIGQPVDVARRTIKQRCHGLHVEHLERFSGVRRPAASSCPDDRLVSWSRPTTSPSLTGRAQLPARHCTLYGLKNAANFPRELIPRCAAEGPSLTGLDRAHQYVGIN